MVATQSASVHEATFDDFPAGQDLTNVEMAARINVSRRQHCQASANLSPRLQSPILKRQHPVHVPCHVQVVRRDQRCHASFAHKIVQGLEDGF